MCSSGSLPQASSSARTPSSFGRSTLCELFARLLAQALVGQHARACTSPRIGPHAARRTRDGAAHLCGVRHVDRLVADLGAGHFDAANRRANLALRQDGAHLPADGPQIRLAGGLSDQGALQAPPRR